jgi:hypothetical protein
LRSPPDPEPAHKNKPKPKKTKNHPPKKTFYEGKSKTTPTLEALLRLPLVGPEPLFRMRPNGGVRPRLKIISSMKKCSVALHSPH